MRKRRYITHLARVKHYTISDNDTRVYAKLIDPMTLNQADRRSGTHSSLFNSRYWFRSRSMRVLFRWVLFAGPRPVYLLIYHSYRVIDRFNYRGTGLKFRDSHSYGTKIDEFHKITLTLACFTALTFSRNEKIGDN